MKKTLLFIFLIVTIVCKVRSQTEISDLAAGLSEPSYLVTSGTDLYVIGSNNLYKVDTTINNPTPEIIYTTPADFFLVNLAINGSELYLVLENYVIATDTFLGGKISSLDLNNPTNPPVDIYTASNYISSLTNNGDTIYFTEEILVNPPDFEPFTTDIKSIESNGMNIQTLVSDFLDTSVTRGMVYTDDTLYLSSSDDNTVYSVDVLQANPTPSVSVDNLLFNRGIFYLGTELYVTEGNLLRKYDLSDPNPTTTATTIAENTTYEDMNNNMPFFANFRDVVIIGNTAYMTLRDQGLVVQAEDTTLSLDSFNSNNDLEIKYFDNKLHISGLKEKTSETVIYDLSGKKLLSKSININNNTINTKFLATGVYILLVENQTIFKFVK